MSPTEKNDVSIAILAKNVLGNSIPATQILSEALGSRALVAGLAGKPTYLIVQDNSILDCMGMAFLFMQQSLVVCKNGGDDLDWIKN